MTDAAAQALAGSDVLANLTSLDVSRNKFSREGAALLKAKFGERVDPRN